MGGKRKVDFMFPIRFLNFFDHPVICYKFLNTLYSLAKPTSDFLNFAVLHFMVTERNAAIMEWKAIHIFFIHKTCSIPVRNLERKVLSASQYGKNAAFQLVIRKKCGAPLCNTEKCDAPLCNMEKKRRFAS